jgi:4-hydroxy-4-methyl-2-oxoglutarate aldolase
MSTPPTRDEAAARLRELGSSVVADALRDIGHSDQTARHGLRPVARRHACAGTVRTAHFEPVAAGEGDFLPLAEFIDSARPGEVLVLDSARDALPGSMWGEICSTAATARGAAGVVIDGFMRDELALEALALPLFSRGAHSRDFLGRSTVAAIDVPIEVGGVAVAPGDLVVADIDGVVFFGADLLAELLPACEDKARAEASLMAAVSAGGSLREAVGRVGTL